MTKRGRPMLQAVGHILPIAVAVALSSVPITVIILILLSPNRNRSAIPFLIGWLIGLAGVATAFVVFANLIPKSIVRKADLGIAIVLMVVGIALIVFSIVSWRKALGRPPTDSLPRWLRAVSSIGPFSAFGLAIGLNLRPKALLLSAAVGVSITADNLNVASGSIVILIYTLVASVTVSIPVILTLASPTRMEPRLIQIRSWLERNNRTVSIVIMLVIGVVIFSNGLTRL
ncbi:GAP family protein [Leifsonia sp. YAF41]|uniref:GAP family protein n=1 Tax=Leifsonia sp. YAF41 TaxID=3233086 RepID=UPI003F9789C4